MVASGFIFDEHGRDITMDVLSAAVDEMHGPWMSPDCWAGKHEPSCSGGAWDEDEDAPTPCECPCHGEYDADLEDEPGPVDVPTGDYL